MLRVLFLTRNNNVLPMGYHRAVLEYIRTSDNMYRSTGCWKHKILHSFGTSPYAWQQTLVSLVPVIIASTLQLWS